MTAPRRRTSSERGVVTAMFAVLAVFLLLIISVVGEGGRKLSNLSQAEDLALATLVTVVIRLRLAESLKWSKRFAAAEQERLSKRNAPSYCDHLAGKERKTLGAIEPTSYDD